MYEPHPAKLSAPSTNIPASSHKDRRRMVREPEGSNNRPGNTIAHIQPARCWRDKAALVAVLMVATILAEPPENVAVVGERVQPGPTGEMVHVRLAEEIVPVAVMDICTDPCWPARMLTVAGFAARISDSPVTTELLMVSVSVGLVLPA